MNGPVKLWIGEKSVTGIRFKPSGNCALLIPRRHNRIELAFATVLGRFKHLKFGSAHNPPHTSTVP